jgi:hypothetical protein
MASKDVVRDFARYNADGDFEVVILPDGLPRLTSLLPAPMMCEDRRAALIEQARCAAILSGYHIVSQRCVRNPAFDGPGEKTSTEFVMRPCKNKREAAAVAAQIGAILVVDIRPAV